MRGLKVQDIGGKACALPATEAQTTDRSVRDHGRIPYPKNFSHR
jgi:hypothetical protein